MLLFEFIHKKFQWLIKTNIDTKIKYIIMKKAILSIGLASLLFFSSCDVLMEILNSAGGTTALTQSEIVEGLKKALVIGAETSSKTLNATDGYFRDKVVKILLPPEANVIVENLSKVPGLGQKTIDDVVLKINRAAEDAAIEAKPIFIDAITTMTVTDGMNILQGKSTHKTGFDSTAATMYLKDKTYSKLVASFSPKINASLDKKIVGNVSTVSAWTSMTGIYNKVAPFIGKPKVTTDLGAYVTKKALDGLFYKVGLEEKKIRKDPFKYASDIIKKVFGSVKK
jgi:hypothetical protein